jgi:hypothetical protein
MIFIGNPSTDSRMYKVVQIWPGLFVCKQVTVCHGHIWTTLYLINLGRCHEVTISRHKNLKFLKATWNAKKCCYIYIIFYQQRLRLQYRPKQGSLDCLITTDFIQLSLPSRARIHNYKNCLLCMDRITTEFQFLAFFWFMLCQCCFNIFTILVVRHFLSENMHFCYPFSLSAARTSKIRIRKIA